MKDKIYPNLGKLIKVSSKIPVVNNVDGVAMNTKASRLMCHLYGIPPSSYGCGAHTSDGILKQLVRSETKFVV